MTTHSRRAPAQYLRRTQRERRALSQERMLEAALALIAQQGSSRTTLSQIGERSGYTHGLVSHRFGSKGQLVRTLIEKLQSDFARSVQPSLEGAGGLDAVKLLCERYLRGAAQRHSLAMYVLIGEALGPVPEIRPDLALADENFRRAIRKELASGIGAGEIRSDIDPLAQATLIVASLRGLVIQRLLNPRSFNLDKVCDELILNLERTLKAEVA